MSKFCQKREQGLIRFTYIKGTFLPSFRGCGNGMCPLSILPLLKSTTTFLCNMKCTFQFPVCNVMMYLLYCAILYLTAAHAQIHGEAAVYVKVGSTISLTCTINLYSVPPPDITWYHGSKVILFWRQNSNETLKWK